MALAFAIALSSAPALGSPPAHKRSKSDRDIDAIGHRQAARGLIFYSPKKEKEEGDKVSAAFDRVSPVLRDQPITDYLERVAQRVASNSDATVPIAVRVVDSDKVEASTLPGYVYVTRGLLLKMQNEGELASIVAREIAHTALHTWARAATVGALLQVGLPTIQETNGAYGQAGVDMANSLVLLRWRRDFETDADYFGIQYVYKAGYDTDCFLSAIQNVSSPDSDKMAKAFSPFPPLRERLKDIQGEISEILPKQEGVVVSSPEFAEFQQRLHSLPPIQSDAMSKGLHRAPQLDTDPMPKLLRHDPQASD
jgi:predicted Zn-dependent protease